MRNFIKTNKLTSCKKMLFASMVFLLSSTSVIASTAYTGMRNITGAQFTADMGRGWNLGNTLDAHGTGVSGIATETMWGNPTTTKAMIDEVKEAGFNTIRIPVTWYKHIGAAPDYTIDAAWLNRVEEVMSYAFDNDMYVIINTHHETEDWLATTYANQAAATAQLEKIWTQLANRFNSYGDYLIFETINEPRVVGGTNEWNGGTTEYRAVVNDYNKAAVDIIRGTGGNNATRFIMCPTYAGSTHNDVLADYVVPNNDSKVIATVHSYFPYNFSNRGEDGGDTDTWGSATDKAQLDAEMQKIYDRFIANDIPVVIGEWGSKDRGGNTAARATHADYYVAAAEAQGLSTIWWDQGGNSVQFKLLNRPALTWDFPAIVNAITGSNIPEPTNIVSNGTFDSTGSWTLYEANGGTGNFNVQDGAGYIDITTASSANWHVALYQLITIENGTDYSISFKAKVESPRTITMAVQQTVSPYATYAAEQVSLTTTMQTFGPYMYTGDLSSSDVKIAFLVGDLENGVYLDNVIMEKESEGTDPVTYVLTVNNGSGGGSFQENDEQPITANAPASGQIFDAWTGDTSYVTNINSASTTVTMPAMAASVTATYKADEGNEPPEGNQGTIILRAKGQCGGEIMDLRVNGTSVYTQTLTNRYVNYEYNGVVSDDIEVHFTNHSSSPCNMKLYLYRIIVDGTTYNTKTSTSRYGSGSLIRLDENGYFDFNL